MTAFAFFSIGLALVSPQDDADVRRALEILRQSAATIEVDAKAPGKPVVAVNL